MQTDPFEDHRSLLFAMAYRMLGSAMEAEDIVQETYLRYRATPPESIRTLKSFLTTIVHNLCINQLKSAQARRENYIGPWLPEPIVTSDGASRLSPLNQMAERESISMAFLVLLESLSPLERAVFLLREVFDYEAACRQLFSRAKKHITEQRPRFPASPEAHENMVGRFMDACLAGDMHGLMSLLAEDVTAWSDSGGKVSGALRHPVYGRDKVARVVIAFIAHAPEGTTVELIEVNGLPALLTKIQGHIAAVLTLEVEADVIRAVRTVANPDKLAHVHMAPTSNQVWTIKP